MPITITEELRKGPSGNPGGKSNKDGGSRVRIFLVAGLTPDISMWDQAMVAVDGAKRIPRYFDPHPFATWLVALDIAADPYLNSNDTAVVTVTYGVPSFVNLQVGTWVARFNGTTRMLRSNYDADGKKISVIYNTGTDGSGHAIKRTVVGEIESPKGFGILTFETAAYSPPQGLLSYFNKINNAPWNGGANYTWWLRDVQFEAAKNVAGFKLAYVFEYDDQNHLKVDVYRDSITGFIPNDINSQVDKTVVGEANGYTVVKPNGFADFNNLNLPTFFT